MSQRRSRSARTRSIVAVRWDTRAAFVVGVDSVLGVGAGAGAGDGLGDGVGAETVSDVERASTNELISFSSLRRF